MFDEIYSIVIPIVRRFRKLDIFENAYFRPNSRVDHYIYSSENSLYFMKVS